VRFTLAADDFEPWLTVLARYPEWTTKHIASLRDSARSRGQATSGWYCRPEPLPIAKVCAVHTRAYTSHSWEPFELSRAVVFDGPESVPTPNVDSCGIMLGAKIYWSSREMRGEETFYTFIEPTLVAEEVYRALTSLYPG
jgi:hypothetical protein